MSSEIEGKAKVIACSWNDIKGQIIPESEHSTQLFHCFKELRLKTSRKERSYRRLATWKYWKDSRIIQQKIWTKNRRV